MKDILKILEAGIQDNNLVMQEICVEEGTNEFNEMSKDGKRAIQMLRLLNNCLDKMRSETYL